MVTAYESSRKWIHPLSYLPGSLPDLQKMCHDSEGVSAGEPDQLINQWTRARGRLIFWRDEIFFCITLLERTHLAMQIDIRHVGLIPGLGRFPGEGHGNLLQYSCMENPMNRGVQWWLQSWAWNIYQCTTDDRSLLGRLQSLESLRVGPNWVTNHTHTPLMTIMGKFKIKTWFEFKWLFLIYIRKL